MIGSEVLLSLCRSPPPLMAVWEPCFMLFIFLYDFPAMNTITAVHTIPFIF